ncbi:MAG: M14 family metallopeptidase [Patescibacteria group bacterium]
MKKFILIIVIIILIGLGFYFIKNKEKAVPAPVEPVPVVTEPIVQVPVDKTKTVIGTSVEGREIVAYHFGEGDTELLFVGGIHGGYSWNTTLVAYRLMDYLLEEGTTNVIPTNVKVTVIPVLNPDGLSKVATTTGRFTKADIRASQTTQVAGRFNGNTVDLNRNFDCDWQATGKWQSKDVSGGDAVFSEPESQAIKNYVETKKPDAVVVWYSAAGGVFASNCHKGILPETSTLTKTYADASGYPASDDFDFYEITGDMVNWLAKINVPAISVLLSTHNEVEWDKNQKGIDALLKYYSK